MSFLRAKAAKFERLASRTVLQEIHDNKALTMLAPYIGEYLPWTGSALRPSAVCMLFNEIVIHSKSRVLEIGCGISTYFLSKFLAENGGSMVTIDNDAK